MPLGDGWVNASYDYFFRLAASAPTNKVVVVFYDNEAYDQLQQSREKRIDRKYHTTLLNKLADDGCPLVVMDFLFRSPDDSATDASLAAAMRRQTNLVLMADQAGTAQTEVDSARPIRPLESFLWAARTNWGVACFDRDLDQIVRRHWPFPAPGPYPSLSATAAGLAGAALPETPQRQWLRYYDPGTAWVSFSYNRALSTPTNYYRDKVVFIGNKPKTSTPDDNEKDEFRIPYTCWTSESVGGVEIHATAFLNLVNNDWLRRAPWPMELAVLILTGVGFGVGLCLVRPFAAVCCAVGAVLVITIGYAFLVNATNFWFPWLVVIGAQLPCSLGWSVLSARARARPLPSATITLHFPDAGPGDGQRFPETPDHELIQPPFGEGAFGKVWLARNAIGQWQALKAVYRSKFSTDLPYDTEFEGIRRFKPVSEKHSGLLRIELVSAKKPEGYFYYVMELADARQSGWEGNPTSYKPVTLESARLESPHFRLPVRDCINIAITLADALDFLHQNKLTHRDIKPSNVIFVNGRAKLADVGLVTEARSPDADATRVGTPGYMPPVPEPQGTIQADIYALGMLLYVVTTGRQPDFFPGLSTTLVERTGHEDFMKLDSVILKACQLKPEQRYQSVAEMAQALRACSNELG
jgi:CHASE2 domain-containing sensor protein